MRKTVLIFLLSSILFAIASLFWYNEWRYSLPTPIPQNYHTVNTGTIINISEILPNQNNSKPLFLHFLNPSCPCSRFNITHFKSLVRKYSDQVNFAIVVLSEDSTVTQEDIQNKFNISIPVLFDKTIATTCGVYSTPQAVLIYDNKLYYRGNYNKTRYCTDKKSNYAEIAIDSLLNKKAYPAFGEMALKSYGCQLPGCSQ